MERLVEQPDRILVQLAQDGDIEAFGSLYKRHAPALVGYLRAMLAGRGPDRECGWIDAEDLVQDAFRKAWHALPSLREPNNFPAWLRTIGRNLANTKPSKLMVAAGDSIDVPDDSDSTEALIDKNQRQLRLLQAINDLRSDYRDAIHARYFRDPPPTFQQLSLEFDVPAGTIRTNVSRALAQLRKRLGEEFFCD